MNIATLKRAIMLTRAAKITPFIWGHRGIGKSSVVEQICLENRLGFIDFRVSQIEASDLRGLPDKQNGRTVFLPPTEMPIADITWDQAEVELQKAYAEGRDWEVRPRLQPRLKEGILFLDEVNRGQDDVLQSLFQLVLDRRVGLYALPPGWTIVCAGNFLEGYQTNGFTDPAFLNRFCHLTLSCDDQTLPEWVEYMSSRYEGNAIKVIEYASQDLKHLRGEIKGELGFSVQPSPRSWEMVAKIIRITKGYVEYDDAGAEKHVPPQDFGTEAPRAVLAGLIGKELALSFENYDCPVKPQEIIDNGVEKMKAQLATLNRAQVSGLTWGLAGFLKRNIEDDKYGKVAMDYAKWLCHQTNKDVATAFCALMVSGGTAAQKVKASMLSNPNVSRLIGKFAANGKNFAARLAKDPELQDILSKTSWGSA